MSDMLEFVHNDHEKHVTDIVLVHGHIVVKMSSSKDMVIAQVFDKEDEYVDTYVIELYRDVVYVLSIMSR